ncbi:MAG TPA: hypothetical protein VN711_03715 [Candidatus Saccharimonadales bacterium]|nr:hypothetical protein [Candidatus Saccharimonadales bacterium]
MTENQDIPREGPTRSINEMRAAIAQGVTIHQAIANALATDGQQLYTYRQNYGLAQAAGAEPQPLDPVIGKRYGIVSTPADPNNGVNLANSLPFVGGFNSVAAQWYPLIERATAPTSQTQLNLPPEAIAMLEHLPEESRASIVGRLETDLAMEDLIVEEVRQSLAADPSGSTWLEQKAQSEFRDSPLELAGAINAIRGAKRLFDELQVTPSEERPTT